jgi:hypothetical protein
VSAARWVGAVAFGLVLGAVPFLRYVHLGSEAAPHSDHPPRNGGELRMVGDHHLELRRRAGLVEVFVSDAARNPIRARAGQVSWANDHREDMQPGPDRLTAPDRYPDEELRIEIQLEGAKLVWRGRS